MDLANSMNQEEQRYAREGFTSDEELSLYDMLFREDLSKNDIKKLKEVAADLLCKIKNKISKLDHWTDKQETKAAVDNLIRDTLWAELPNPFQRSFIIRGATTGLSSRLWSTRNSRLRRWKKCSTRQSRPWRKWILW